MNIFFLKTVRRLTFIFALLIIFSGIDVNATILPEKNIVVLGKNIDITKQIQEDNFIYEIIDDIDLQGKTISMPSNVVLSFKGGSLNNGIIVGNNTTIDSYNQQIFSDIELQGIWRNDFFSPEWFGASGDGKHDDTKSFRETIKNAFNNHKTLKLLSPYYFVTGDNPLGLDYYDSEKDISFFYKEGLEGDDNRSRYNLNIDGNGAIFYWSPQKINDVFAFVGYLRYSVFQNFSIYCKQMQKNYWGDIFSTSFRKRGQSHIFSNNTFRNIRVSGGCRRVFSFDCTNNEKQSHDDLSLFEKISATDYKVFCYITNGDAVCNAFYNCNTVLCVDGAVDYYIKCPSWAGNLRIVGQHFTIMNCTGAVIIKDETSIVRDRIVYVDMPRLEVLNTASRWKYFDISGITLHMNGIESITNPKYEANNEYGIIRTVYGQVYISDVRGVFQPFALYSIIEKPFRPAYVFNNCAFKVGEDIYSLQEYPIIYYHGETGVYKNTPTALISPESFPYYRVNHSTVGEIRDKSKVSSWDINYNMGKSQVTPTMKLMFATPHVIGGGKSSLVGNAKYTVPCDLIITSLAYNCVGSNKINHVKIILEGKTSRIIELHNRSNSGNKYESNEQIALAAGTTISFRYVDFEGKEKNEENLSIQESFFQMECHTPFLVSEYKLLYKEIK